LNLSCRLSPLASQVGRSDRCAPTARNFAREACFLVVLLLTYRMFWCFRSMEKHPGAPLFCNSHLPGSGAHGSTPRFVVWLLSGGPRLPARRLRPPTAWSRRLPEWPARSRRWWRFRVGYRWDANARAYIFPSPALKRVDGPMHEDQTDSQQRPNRLEGTHLMCAYWDRPGEPHLSKVVSLAAISVPLIRAYRLGSSQFRAFGHS
jgi:hypothetical protein